LVARPPENPGGLSGPAREERRRSCASVHSKQQIFQSLSRHFPEQTFIDISVSST
jgi:hypothetical protein